MRHGYKGTTLEAIIAGAGGSRETVYRVFGGKSGLFSAIISDVGEQLAASMASPNLLSLPPREGLTKLAWQLVEIWQSEEGKAVNRVVLSEGLEAPELVEAWFRGGTELSLKAMARYFEAQVRAGRLVDVDCQLVARQFSVLLIGEMAFPTISGSSLPPDHGAQIERCVDVILRAYGRDDPRLASKT